MTRLVEYILFVALCPAVLLLVVLGLIYTAEHRPRRGQRLVMLEDWYCAGSN